MSSAVFKTDSRTGNKIFHSARNKHLAGFSFIRHAHTHLRSNTLDLAVNYLTLARVKTRACFNSQSGSILSYRRSTPNRTRWTIEDREYPILDDVDLSSTKPLDLFRNVRVQTSQQFQPTICSESLHMFFDADNSSHQHGRKYRVRLDAVTHTSQKLFHLVENRVLIANKRQVIISGKLYKLCTGNSLCNKPTLFNFQTLIVTCDE